MLFFLLDLALNQSPKQSSTWTNILLDGDTRSCAKGRFQKDHWMRVDLGVSRVVAKVVISYKNWIYGLEVWIGEFRKMRRKAEIKYAVKSDLSYVHFQQVMTVAIEAIQTCIVEDRILPKQLFTRLYNGPFFVFLGLWENLFLLKFPVLTKLSTYARYRFTPKVRQAWVRRCLVKVSWWYSQEVSLLAFPEKM